MPLQKKTVELLDELFTQMDTDKNNEISKEEARAFWGNNFSKINATAMFNEVDSDGDDTITKTSATSSTTTTAASTTNSV